MLPKYKKLKTAGGLPHNSSLYVTMRDGVRIAIDVWLPVSLKAGERIPAVMRATRYIRVLEPGPLTKLGTLFGKKVPAETEFEVWDRHNMALVLVDVRGTGASFGTQRAPWSDEEIEDLGEIVDYIVAQPWSDGQVAAYGVSYHGNTAEMITTTRRSAIKAVAPLFSDYDPYMLARPGGILNEQFVRLWEESNNSLDMGDIHRAAKGAAKVLGRLLFRGAQSVDGDERHVLLNAAIAEHAANINVFTSMENALCRDDAFGTGGFSMADVSPYTHRAEIEASHIPMFIAVGISDAETVDGAVERYQRFSNPQRLFIGPWSHGANAFVDPLLHHQKPEGIGLRNEVIEQAADFFCECFESGKKCAGKKLSYYVYGDGKFRESEVWPAVSEDRRLYIAEGGALEHTASAGHAVYKVDYSAATGERNRFFTQMTGGAVDYGDRREDDLKLLTFTSAPLDADAVILGRPRVSLSITSDNADSAVIAYLEDVAPDGSVAYLTEGELHMSQRAGTCLRKDYVEAAPNEQVTLVIPMFTVIARIRAGHRIRLAIAGHDASAYRRYPENGADVTFTLDTEASFIELPIAEIS